MTGWFGAQALERDGSGLECECRRWQAGSGIVRSLPGFFLCQEGVVVFKKMVVTHQEAGAWDKLGTARW